MCQQDGVCLFTKRSRRRDRMKVGPSQQFKELRSWYKTGTSNVLGVVTQNHEKSIRRNLLDKWLTLNY